MIRQPRRFLPCFIGRCTSCLAIIFLMLLAFVIVGLPALSSPQQSCWPNGDVTQDGNLTAADALQVFQQALGLSDPPLNTCELSIADVYPQPNAPDGTITAADALCILRRAVGLPSCLDAPTLESVILTTRLDRPAIYDIPIGDPLDYRILTHPQQGTATLNGNGPVTYSPWPGAVGEDDFEIEVAGSPVILTVDNNLGAPRKMLLWIANDGKISNPPARRRKINSAVQGGRLPTTRMRLSMRASDTPVRIVGAQLTVARPCN